MVTQSLAVAIELGKTAIVEGIATRIVNGEVPESLLEKRVLSVDLGALVAGSAYMPAFA